MTRRVIEEYKKEIKLEKMRQVTERDSDNGVVKKKKMAFLELLLTASENGKMLTNEEVCQEVDTLMAAGHDTTTAALCWAMVCLGSYPDCQVKIHEELDEIFGDSDRPVTNEDLKKMKYLECVIKETLRFYPAGPVFGRLLTEDVKIGKHLLPAGTTIAVLTNQIHRNAKYYDEPDTFKPERFLPENSVGRHPYAYLAFSGGPRNCIGGKFAVMEQKVILSTLFRKFDVTFVDNMRTVKAHTSITLKPQGSVRVKLQRRQR
jgi:cytochrome P450